MSWLLAVVSLVLVQILVGAAPVTNLKEDLRTTAEETFMLIKQNSVKFGFAIVESIIEHKVADQAEIEKWQAFINQTRSRDESWLKDDIEFRKFGDQIKQLLPKVQTLQSLNQYTKGAFSRLSPQTLEFETDQLTRFETKATEMIRVAKEAGFTDEYLDSKYQRFTRAQGHSRKLPFQQLLAYLQGFD